VWGPDLKEELPVLHLRVRRAATALGASVIVVHPRATGLDPVNAATVNNLITSIAEHTRVTSVIVTHDVEGALEMSDRVALLDHGRLRFVGTPEEFRASQDPMVRAFADRRTAAAAALELVERDEDDTENGARE
jgi:phospholipid/cholesterol/gamma-HCH transport system ATP-binding protein